MGSLLDTPLFALLFPPLPRPHEHELGRLGGAGDGEAPWPHSVSFGVGPAAFQAQWEGRTAPQPPTDWPKGPTLVGTTPRNLSGGELLSSTLSPYGSCQLGSLFLCV